MRIGAIAVAAGIHVNRAANDLAATSQRLATMHRINQASDDAAGLIAAEQLHRDITAAEEALGASERSRALARVADSGLSHASRLVTEIEGKLVTAANGATSPAERRALQIEIDAAVEAIDRLGNTTSFAGRPVFSGDSAEFLVGPDPANTTTVELPAVSSGSLGGDAGRLHQLRTGSSASITSGNYEDAAAILGNAREEINNARAELGSFESNTLDTTRNVLQESMANLTAARSSIIDADAAVESARLVQSMIRTDTSILAARATLQAAQSASSLLSDILDS